MKNKVEKKIIKKQGTVISDKCDKTVMVIVESVKEHPIYRKKYAVSKKYKAHDEANDYKVGDKVEISSCRPMSKDKSFIVSKKIK